MTVMISHKPITACMSCSINMIVTPSLVAQPAHERGHPPRLFCVHAGERLVEQHELGVGGQRHGHAQRALVTVGQVGGKLVGELPQAEELKDVERFLISGSFGGAVAPQNAVDEAALGAAVTAEPDVVEDTELMKQGGALKGPDQPQLGEAAGRVPRDVLPRDR